MDAAAISKLSAIREKLSDPFRSRLATVTTAILADETSLWMKVPEREALLMVLNGNPSAGNMELVAEQPLNTGLVSRVFRYGDPFIDPHSLPIRDHSKKIDLEFSQTTHYMAIVPVTLGDERIGVVSAVKFPTEENRIRKASEWGFSRDALEVLGTLADEIAKALAA